MTGLVAGKSDHISSVTDEAIGVLPKLAGHERAVACSPHERSDMRDSRPHHRSRISLRSSGLPLGLNVP